MIGRAIRRAERRSSTLPSAPMPSLRTTLNDLAASFASAEMVDVRDDDLAEVIARFKPSKSMN